MDPAAQDLLQVMKGLGPVLDPLVPAMLVRCFWPCLHLVQDAQLWALSPLSCFPQYSQKIGEWNKVPIFAICKRNITCSGGIFLFFFPEYFFLSLTGEWELPCQLFPTPWEDYFKPKLM